MWVVHTTPNDQMLRDLCLESEDKNILYQVPNTID